PNDERARRLGEALQDLERRVNAMIEAHVSRKTVPGERAAADGPPGPGPAEFILEPLSEASATTPAHEPPGPPPDNDPPLTERGPLAQPTTPQPIHAAPAPAMIMVVAPEPSTPRDGADAAMTSSNASQPAPREVSGGSTAQPETGDPLAALTSMSDEERIALF